MPISKDNGTELLKTATLSFETFTVRHERFACREELRRSLSFQIEVNYNNNQPNPSQTLLNLTQQNNVAN